MACARAGHERDARMPRIAVVGGGITGLTTAFYLLRAGYRVTVLEAKQQVGGLTSSFDFGPFHWDRFYHCILTSDRSLLALLEDLDLTPELRWTKTEVGFYSHDRLYTMTKPADLLGFPHLRLRDKLRFALGVLYAARLSNGKELEGVPLREWVVRVFGENLYREMWEPLLRCKLGALRESASAAFLQATLKRLYSTREKGAQKQEKLGYVAGGYRVVLGRLVERIEALGGEIRAGVRIEQLESEGAAVSMLVNGFREHYASAILTVPNRAVEAICPALPAEFKARLREVKYLAMVCVALVLRRPLSPYYLTNITQESRFTGVVEMSNLIDKIETKGYSLVYLPKYTTVSDPVFSLDDEALWREFSADLFRMYPRLHSSDIVAKFMFREPAVQPVPTLHYSSAVLPPMETPLPGIFLANTSQIVNNTLNNNVMTEIARKVAARVIEHVSEAESCLPDSAAASVNVQAEHAREYGDRFTHAPEHEKENPYGSSVPA